MLLETLILASDPVLQAFTTTNPEALPGSEKIQQIINWAIYILGGAAIIGLIGCCIMMAAAPSGSGGHRAGAGIGKVLVACILGGAAGLIVNNLV